MSKAAKQWRGAVIRLFTRLGDLWAGVGGSCRRSLAGDAGGAGFKTGFQTTHLQVAESPAESCSSLRRGPNEPLLHFGGPPALRLGRMPPNGDAEPAQMCHSCPKFRRGELVCSLCVGLEGRALLPHRGRVASGLKGDSGLGW